MRRPRIGRMLASGGPARALAAGADTVPAPLPRDPVTIHYFADHQNVVFVPALLALLAATLLVCLPIVFVQALTRSGRRTPVTAIAWVLAAVALVLAGWQASVGVGALADERGQLRAGVEARYGVTLTASEANELLDGGKPRRTLPEQAEAAGLLKPQDDHPLSLVPIGGSDDRYSLAIGGRPIPIARG